MNTIAMQALKTSAWLIACLQALDAGSTVYMLEDHRALSAASLYAAA